MQEPLYTRTGNPHESLRTRAAARFSTLNEAEHQVLMMLLEGASHKVIANRLDVSIRTIESRRARIMQKTGASSLPALVRWAMLANYRGIAEQEPQ